MTKHGKRLLPAALAALVLTGCAMPAPDSTTTRYKVAIVAKNDRESEFWDAVFTGAEAAATEYNMQLTVSAPNNEENYEVQNRLIAKAVEDGAQAIVFSAIDYEENAAAIDAAAAAGVTIVGIDSAVDSDHVAAYIGVDNYGAGQMAAQSALDGMEGELHVGLINYEVNGANGQEREQGARDTFAASGRADIIAAVSTHPNAKSARTDALAMLRDHPELNVLIASTPIADKDTEKRVKLNVLAMLNEAYGITERDFTRAEIEVVPAHKARDIGLDRAMIGAYGHDDRVDAYPALMAEIGVKNPAYTSVCVLTDKEETGSDGVTGLNSMYTFHFLQQLCAGQGADYITACKAAKCLSADVTAAYDPTFADAFEPDNGTYAGRGVAVYKYTGSRGKGGTSDASAETVSYLTRLMDKNNIVWQIGEMGKLDLGGGGTVAKYVANQDIDTIDIGVPVLSMHAPFEVVSKADVYMAYLTFKAFCEDAE